MGTDLDDELAAKDARIAELLKQVDSLRAERAAGVEELSKRAEELERKLVAADLLPMDATGREAEQARELDRLAREAEMKEEMEEQREKLQEDLYSGAKEEAREELMASGFYMPMAQPIPQGGRVIGYNLVSRTPPPNYYTQSHEDRMGLRYRPGAVSPHISAIHDGHPGSYTYVGDLYVPDFSGGMSKYMGPQVPQVSGPIDRGGANFFRVLAGLPAEKKYRNHYGHLNMPMHATVGVDVDGDGRADFLMTGVDRNGDGIPDVMQPGLRRF
jgi:hypothetical protein